IKIIQSGIMSFDEYGVAGPLEFSKEELTYLINRAHDADLKTMVHVNTPKGVEMAIEAGADSIEHGYCIDEDCIQGLKENGVVWVPTLSPFANIAACKENHPLAQYREISRKYFTEHRQRVRTAHKKGVTIALGSDAGAALVVHGKAAKDELGYLRGCGLNEEEIFKNSSKVLELKL
ncbi:MAG: amidohydrolase family protein, partial [Eubacterium sp.]